MSEHLSCNGSGTVWHPAAWNYGAIRVKLYHYQLAHQIIADRVADASGQARAHEVDAVKRRLPPVCFRLHEQAISAR